MARRRVGAAITEDRRGSGGPAPLVIVSNRGPKDFVWKDGEWIPSSASGGLVSMLAPLARRPDVRWFCCVSEPPDAKRAAAGLFTTEDDQTGGPLPVTPVLLPSPVYHAYYGLISNEILWMLQHHLLNPNVLPSLDAERHRAWRDGYLAANATVADSIKKCCPTARAFLLQDYHLYPLPALLRRSFPDTPILHFTHIPFPEPSLMRLLPKDWRETILRGLLGADVVGLQTQGDARAFLSCCAELLGTPVDSEASEVEAEDGRRVLVRVYPASVDPDEVAETMASEAVKLARPWVHGLMGDLSIVRVDRADPSKNQVIGFKAFERLLDLRPDLRSRLRFSAFLVPSRTDLKIYRSCTEAIYQTIGEINSRFAAECGRAPIDVFYTNDRNQALAAMEDCDVLLVNSLQDGMNLVAKEWALVSTRPGVLVVSETAGVAEAAMGTGLLVSPLDLEGTAVAMSKALDMPSAERAVRLSAFRNRVSQWTAKDWLSAQLADLGV
ncbi:MAG: trehalose-6-phosphate synthase [Chloroflexi bacterium]|nr:trehalose-6-phosphate synthase [Chloroflexota bacterium]